MAEKKLTTKQKLFVEYYLANPNATQAAIKAGYSEKTAKSQGQRLLTNVDIANRVSQRVETAVMSADEVLLELSNIAKSAWEHHFEYQTLDGEIVRINVKLADKIKTLDLLGKYHKLFTEKQEITGKDGGAIDLTTTIVIQGAKGNDGPD